MIWVIKMSIEVTTLTDIAALLGLEKQISETGSGLKIAFYDIGLLPEHILKQYMRDRAPYNHPVLPEAKHAVYSHDFEPWRRQFIRRLQQET